MNYFWLLLTLGLVSQALGFPDYRERFEEQFQRGDFPRMENTLRDWESSCPDDVEMLGAYGSYYYNKSKQGVQAVPDKRVAREDIALAGKAVKTASRPRFDPKGMQKAAAYWKRAVQLYPWRLDLCFWLAHLYQDLDDFDSQYQTLAETLLYADKNRGKMRWEKNARLPGKPSKFIPETLRGYSNYYFAQQRQTDDEKAFRLAKLAATFFPNHPDAYNSMAAYYWSRNDGEHALKYLIIASQKDPRDSLVLDNIGNTLVKLDQPGAARIFYRRVVRLNRDPEFVADAKKRLEELDGE